jgi:hypothetical protein
VLIYHAIAFWIPSLGGLLGYRRLRRHLTTDTAVAHGAEEAIPARPASVAVLTASAK